MRPCVLRRGEGWTYRYGIDFTVKAEERGPGPRVAVLEYTIRRGEEPPPHTHETEDEIFDVLKGDGDVQLRVVTSPAREDALGGWGGCVADLESTGEAVSSPPDPG